MGPETEFKYLDNKTGYKSEKEPLLVFEFSNSSDEMSSLPFPTRFRRRGTYVRKNILYIGKTSTKFLGIPRRFL